MPDLLANLNPEQLAAVTLPNEPALILAGAGSGKTRVLITRIAWLIQQGYASPPTVLAVTFTNKAAKEMMARLTAMMPIDTRGMWIGTFHGLCNRMLRAHFRDAGLPQTFQILDTADQLSAIKRMMKGLNIDDEKYPPKNLQYFINNAKEQGLRPKDVDATDAFNMKFVELYMAYEQQCQREGVVDFPELLLRCYELLAHNPPLRAHYQARFRNILVDEFQDTNKLQYAWLKLLAGEHNAIFAVGDDDQSIYAFRGANVGNMHDFEREYHVRNMIKLEQNYRSHGHILDTANHLIAKNARRLGKNLRTDAGHGEPVRVYEAATDTQEAGWIVEEIKALISTGLSRGDIAILYRSNAQSRTIEHTLVNAGIAYRVYGGLRFFERQEVKHALAYLRLIDNPNDDTAFSRVVNFPARGIGARSIEQLADAARLYNCSMAAAVPYVAGKAGSSLAGFATLVAKMRGRDAADELARDGGVCGPHEWSRYVLRERARRAGPAGKPAGSGECGGGVCLGGRLWTRYARAFHSIATGRDERPGDWCGDGRSRRRCAGSRESLRSRAKPRHDDAARGFPVACIARSRRQPGASRPGRRPVDDRARGEGSGVPCGLHDRPGRGPVPP